MGIEVKPLSRRDRKARATRRAILDAARRLFVAHGYVGTTIQAIAEEADVAVQTVYAGFTNKRTILAEVLDVTIAGDDAEISVNAREWMRPVWEAPTADERLRGYAAAVRQIMDRAGDVFTVVTSAAEVDPEAVALSNETESRRRAGAASVVDAVLAVGRLRADLDRERAVDVLWLLNSPAVHRQLVRRSGWSAAEYERWLADSMVSQLLGERAGDALTPR